MRGRHMSSSASNGASLLFRVVFTTNTIDEMQTFGTPSPPMTLDDFQVRYRAVCSAVAKARAGRGVWTRLSRRGFCVHPAEI